MIPDFRDKDNYARMQHGEWFNAFAPELVTARRRCSDACRRFNKADSMSRREMVQYWQA